MEGTLGGGAKAFGTAILKLFDFIDDSLPKKDISNLRFYNKRSFVVFDKYLVLREVNTELNEQMS